MKKWYPMNPCENVNPLTCESRGTVFHPDSSRSRRVLFFVCTLFALAVPTFAEVPIATSDSLNSDTSVVVGRHTFWSNYNIARMGAIGIAGGTMVYSAGVWWVNDYRAFHWWNAPWFGELGVDKIGHMYTAYALYKSLHEVLLWGGHDTDDAFWWAAGVAAFHGFMVEVGDGFSEYGFDFRDVTFNYIGLTYGMLQTKIPFLRNFDLKWSLYYPMKHHAFKINDLYVYHIYWMSINVKNLLPEVAKPYWPSVIQIAFGLGAEDQLTTRTYNLSFDYNIEALPIEGSEAGLFKRLLNLFHYPAPGVKFAPGHAPEFKLFLLH